VRLSIRSLEFLVGVITGDSGKSSYRSGPNLVEFFNSHGEIDLYGKGFPSRHVYVREKLIAINGEDRLKDIVTSAFDFGAENEDQAEDAALQFTKLLVRDGFKLVKKSHGSFEFDGKYHDGSPYFQVQSTVSKAPPAPPFLLNQDTLSEYTVKAKDRIENSDFSGAITVCYTLIEGFLKLSLEGLDSSFNKDEGDIKKLYKTFSKAAGLNASADTPDSLKPLLNGLTTLVSGFYEISNKSGDRHAPKYKASQHHAKLVVSVTYAFCEFLVESQAYRLKEN